MYADAMSKSALAKKPVTIRLSAEVREEIRDIMRRTGRDFSSIAHEMLEEALKMRRIPGIYFTDTPTGRHAHIAGTGLGVWEIVRVYREENNDWEALRESFDWLTEQQLRTALAYAEAYPEEIGDRIALEDEFSVEEVWKKYPFTRPP